MHRRPPFAPLRPGSIAIALAAAFLLQACALFRPAAPRERTLEVTATAYNSLASQGAGDGKLTAFGLRLRPGMRIVAVSRDLLALGLDEGVRLRIDGLDGEWEVGDKMNERWRRRIDVYLGTDVDAARRFGERSVTIRWRDDAPRRVRSDDAEPDD